MGWLAADDIFEEADAENEAMLPAPWIHRRIGPMRKPDEDNMRRRGPGSRTVSLEERLSRGAARIRAAEEAVAEAGPQVDVQLLRYRLSGQRAVHTTLLRLRRSQS